MHDFEDKVAVITGAASGIGRAIAVKCVQLRMKVVISDIDVEKLSQVEESLRKVSKHVISVIADVAKEDDIKSLHNEALKSFGKIHMLFNNAGIPGPVGPIWEIEAQELDSVMKINLMSVVYGLTVFIPTMIKQKEECYVVNIASGAGLHTGPYITGYMASKHAVVALSEVLYFDLKQRNLNINVSVLCTGLVNTEFANALEDKPDYAPDVKNLVSVFRNNIKQGMEPDDVAEHLFKGIRLNQFYILTHLSEHRILIQTRMDDILRERNPTRR